MLKTTLLMALLGSASGGHAIELVSQNTVDQQKKVTSTQPLKNGIKVVYRQVDHTEIAGLNLTLPFGVRDLPPDEKGLIPLVMSMMSQGAKGYDKAKIHKILQKYSTGVSCSYGIELSTCSMAVINEYWDQVLPLFAAVVNHPTFEKADIELQKNAKIAELESKIEQPSSYVNEVANRFFYPKGHPYKSTYEGGIEQMKAAKRADLARIHKRAIASNKQFFTFVGSMPQSKVMKDLNRHFGQRKVRDVKTVTIKPPKFQKAKSVSFSHKDIPTAYMAMKFNGPGVRHPDFTDTKLMIRVLSEELGLEVRTRRSLSYAVHSYMLGNSIGIGMISVTTSKPKETLEAVSQILTKMKSERYTQEALNRFKTVYTTNYFLTLESHLNLAGALASTFFHHHSVDPFYDMPLVLNKATAKNIQRLAKEYLNNFRMGIIFSKDRFKEEWAHKFVGSHLAL